jgi:hypothetical protein
MHPRVCAMENGYPTPKRRCDLGRSARTLSVCRGQLYSCVSKADEWDHYEGLFCRGVERFARNHPQGPDAPAFRERIRSFRECYRRWSRDTMDFGFYLFSKP